MRFVWADYLELARHLAGDLSCAYTDEAASRSAVSRAYYAAFCHARGYCTLRLGFRPRGTSSDHDGVRACLHRNGYHDLAIRLEQLRRWRNHCDYDNVVRDPAAIASSAVRFAQIVVGRL